MAVQVDHIMKLPVEDEEFKSARAANGLLMDESEQIKTQLV